MEDVNLFKDGLLKDIDELRIRLDKLDSRLAEITSYLNTLHKMIEELKYERT